MRAAGLFGAAAFLGFALAEVSPYTATDIDAYDAGELGRYPLVTFKTTHFPCPRVLLRHWEPSCYDDDDHFWFLAPYGPDVVVAGPIVLDAYGKLVWYHGNDLMVHSFDFKVQEYRGEAHLTWWTGDDWVRGHGSGSYHMVDSTLRVTHKLGALNGIPADMHEFHITRDDTALVTAYVKMRFDLTPFGTEDGYIWDSVFQEYDIQTQQLLFEWRASKHVDISAAAIAIERHEVGNGTLDFPWDWFHINSVDKDHQGNYLVSARGCSSLLYVNGRSGKVEWFLGGNKNDFEDLSGGAATDFKWQHNARWADDFTAITLFDNQVRQVKPGSRPSRGLKLAVDQRRKTASVLHAFEHPLNVTGVNQGSVQRLDNGNFLLGFGHAPVATEFSPDGNVVCDLSFGPLRATRPDGKIGHGISESYRVYKMRWKATPYYDPDVFLDLKHGEAIVSWNGATEVKFWQLELANADGNWVDARQLRKTGFETTFPIPARHHESFRLTALDKGGSIIRRWIVNARGMVQAEVLSAALPRPRFPSGPMTAGIVVALLVVGVIIFRTTRRISRLGSLNWTAALKLDFDEMQTQSRGLLEFDEHDERGHQVD